MPTSESSSVQSRQIIERYCHIIDGNAVLARVHTKEGCMFECLSFEKCKGNGGCRNAKYSSDRVSK